MRRKFVGKIFGTEDLFGTMFSSIQGALQGLGPKISESFSEGFSSLSGVGKDVGNFLKEGLSSAFDGIGSMIGDALGGIASAWILATGKISAGFTWVTGKLQLGMDMLMAWATQQLRGSKRTTRVIVNFLNT